jgi:DNA (cytosine-5)-methyltransferase 1
MSLQLVSLFAGVGGFDIAAERAGIDPVVACEIDPQARGVLQHRLPNTTLINDVKDVTGERLTELGLDPRRTVITGGFPCQDLSIAGKQAGLEGGERSSLFFEIVRILREFNPQWFILENVPGLLSSKGGRDMGIVIGSLAELGYSFSWRILDAQNFGVPQRRRRVFIVGHFGADETRAEQVLFEPEGSGRNLEAGQSQGQDVTGNPAPSVDESKPFVKIVRSGARDQDGNLPAEVWAEQDVAPTLNGMDNSGESYATVLIHNKQSDGDVRLYDDISPTVTRTWGTGGNNVPMIETETQPTTVRRLTPMECERLQGFPDGWSAQRIDHKKGIVVDQADSSRYKQMGNAVAVPVVEWIFNRLVLSEETA